MEYILSTIDPTKLEGVVKNLKSVPDEKQINVLESRPWWNSNHVTANKFVSTVIEGTHLVADPDDEGELESLIKFSGLKIIIPDQNDIKLNIMEYRRCHDNSFELFKQGKVSEMHSGYALSDDGLWRHHSWCIDDEGNVVETTIKRLVYLATNILNRESLLKMASKN